MMCTCRQHCQIQPLQMICSVLQSGLVYTPVVRPYIGSLNKSLGVCCCEWVCDHSDVICVFNGTILYDDGLVVT